MAFEVNPVDTLFFLISIIGLIVITFWAYRNDRRTGIAEQDGILAIKLPPLSEDLGPLPEPVPEPPSPSRRPARRRFISP